MAKKKKVGKHTVESGFWSEKQRKFVDKPLGSSDNVWGSEKIIKDFMAKKKKYIKQTGTLDIIDLMCHETAHHRTSRHAKGFKIKYARFFKFIINKLISGEYYQ